MRIKNFDMDFKEKFTFWDIDFSMKLDFLCYNLSTDVQNDTEFHYDLSERTKPWPVHSAALGCL